MKLAFQAFLVLLAVSAVVSGSVILVLGASGVIGVSEVSPQVDSEMRFFAAWYVAAGVLVLRSVRRLEDVGTVVRWVSVVAFVAGSARLLSFVTVGDPGAVAVTLMGIELALPFVLIPWHNAVLRSPPRAASGR